MYLVRIYNSVLLYDMMYIIWYIKTIYHCIVNIYPQYILADRCTEIIYKCLYTQVFCFFFVFLYMKIYYKNVQVFANDELKQIFIKKKEVVCKSVCCCCCCFWYWYFWLYNLCCSLMYFYVCLWNCTWDYASGLQHPRQSSQAKPSIKWRSFATRNWLEHPVNFHFPFHFYFYVDRINLHWIGKIYA